MDDELRIAAINKVSRNTNVLDNLDDFVKKVAKQFVESKLEVFPQLCFEARKVNYLKKQEDDKLGNPGGWSEKRDFKFDYIIPTDLYMFMVNMIYRNFWSDENKKVWRSFMRGIMCGTDPMELLKRVRVYYGALSNQTGN